MATAVVRSTTCATERRTATVEVVDSYLASSRTTTGRSSSRTNSTQSTPRSCAYRRPRPRLTSRREYKEETGEDAPYFYKFISALSTPLSRWATLETRAYAHGHCLLSGYMGLRPADPDTVFYETSVRKKYGPRRRRKSSRVTCITCSSTHASRCSRHSQQLRAIRPLGPDKTLTELWHFRLKGAPEPIYRRSLAYFNLINSPSTLVNADDLINFWRCQEGLNGEQANEWVSFHRNAGRTVRFGRGYQVGERSQRNADREMFRAWSEYMKEGTESVPLIKLF